jgi:hypothetical protein
MTGHLARNLEVLAKRQPVLARLLAETPADPAYRLVQAEDGSLVIARVVDGRSDLFSYPKDAAALGAQFVDQQADLLTGAHGVLFVGMRAGYELREFLARLPRRDYEPLRGVYVYEEHLDLLRLALTAMDWSEPLSTSQLALFGGPDAGEQCRRYFLDDPAKPPPTQLATLGDHAMAQRALAAVQATIREISQRVTAAKQQLRARYDALSGFELARLFFAPAGLRVLLLNNKLSYFTQYSVRDLAMTLEHLGATVDVLEERSLVDRLTGPLQLQTLDRFRPHAVLFIDHARHESGDVYPPGLPFVTFVQDFMQSLNAPEAGRQTVARDLFIGSVQFLYDKEYRPDALFWLPAWTNPLLYARQRPAPAARYVADVSFVSNVSRHHAQAFRELGDTFGAVEPRLRGVLRDLYDEALALHARGETVAGFQTFREQVYARLAAAGIALSRPLVFVVEVYDKLINSLLRHQTLEWVAETGCDLALWGRGWEQHPTLGRYARGVADNGDELIDIYRGSRVNLHVNQYNIEHPRLMDGMAAGGFFLVRESSSFGVLDLAGCTFGSREELRTRLSHFLARPEERQAVVDRNRERIERVASYRAGLENSLAYFALRLLSQQLLTTDASAWPTPASSRADELAGRLADLADRHFLDATRFGVAALLEWLIAAEMIPASARERLDGLDAYQARWGAKQWPYPVDRATRARFVAAVAEWSQRSDVRVPGAVALLEAWRHEEDGVGLAYRHLQHGTPLRAEDARAVRDAAEAARLIWPDLRRTRSAVSLDRERQSVAATPWEPDLIAAKRARMRRLQQRGCLAGAMALAEDLAEAAPNPPWTTFDRAIFALFAGKRRAALAFFAQAFDEAERGRHTAMIEIAGYCLANAQFVLGDANEAERTLARLAPRFPASEGIRFLQGRRALLRGDREAARRSFAGKTPFKNSAFETFAAQYRSLLDSWTAGGPRLLATHPLPALGEDQLRVDRLRVLSGRQLVGRCRTSGEKLLVWDPAEGQFAPLAERGVDVASAGPYPAFDVHEGRLHLVDVETPQLLIYDEAFALVRRLTLPRECRHYVEDIAIAMDGTIAVVDSYRGLIWLLDASGAWRAQPYPVADDDLALWLVRCGDGLAACNGPRLMRLRTDGAVTTGIDLDATPASLCGDAFGVYATTLIPARVDGWDANLAPRFRANALPDRPWWRPSAIAAAPDRLFVVDEFLQVLAEYEWPNRSPDGD